MPATPRASDEQGLPVYAHRVLTTRITHRWWTRAACATAPPRVRMSPEKLSALCGGCPVRKSCLATALLTGADGIWAATTVSQRQQARNRMVDGAPPGRVFAHLLTNAVADTDRGAAMEGEKS